LADESSAVTTAAPPQPTPREELLAFLREGLTGDHEGDHSKADGLLLAALADDEVTTAWYSASGSWWYA
jgi:hypothetical protein